MSIMLIMLTVITSDLSNQSDHFKILITQWLFYHCCYIISCKKVLTVDFLLKFSSWKSLFIHVFYCSTKNFILRCKDFLECMSSEHAVMHLCEHCSHLQKKCCIDNEINCCIKCVHFNRKYDLTFLMMKWKRIKTEHDYVFHELLNIHKQM